MKNQVEAKAPQSSVSPIEPQVITVSTPAPGNAPQPPKAVDQPQQSGPQPLPSSTSPSPIATTIGEAQCPAQPPVLPSVVSSKTPSSTSQLPVVEATVQPSVSPPQQSGPQPLPSPTSPSPIATTIGEAQRPTQPPVLPSVVSSKIPSSTSQPSATQPQQPGPQPLPSPKPSSSSASTLPVQVRNPYLDKDPHLQNNIQTICEFPEDKNAQIKSTDGKLIRGEGFWRIYNAQIATQLHDTIPVILKTFETAHKIYEEAFRAVTEQPTTTGKIGLMRALCDTFIQEKKLLKGLENIKKVYEARYKEAPEHKGLNQLNSLHKEQEQKINAYSEQYEALVQPLRQETEGTDLTETIFLRATTEPTTEQAAKSLSAYCDKYCHGLSSIQAKERILEGQKLLQCIVNNPTFQASKDPKVVQAQLANITWFLMYTWGIDKKRGASEAAFVIENLNLYNFMMSVPAAYERTSTHFIGRSPETTRYSSYLPKSSNHHGIDIEEGLLPARKRTILFEKVDSPQFINPKLQQVLFFKPENWGTQDPLSVFQHSMEYVESVQKKSRAEGEDDAPGMQKERVPDNAKKAFIALLDHIRANTAYTPILQGLDTKIYDLNTALDKATLWGIAYMHAFINAIATQTNCPAGFKEAAQNLTNIITLLPHPDRQTGRELYITKEELKDKVEGKLDLV
jgi:hypothetical protein